MKIILFEVCRTPEIPKPTEIVVLSRFFTEHNINFERHSNDQIWPNPTPIDKTFIQTCLRESDANIVHLALHGNDYGLILKWSGNSYGGKRVPEEMLMAGDIVQMEAWRGKIIVSGACSSAKLARYFLHAGAVAVIAPEYEINWLNLGDFFSVLYGHILARQGLKSALDLAIVEYSEYGCYQIYR